MEASASAIPLEVQALLRQPVQAVQKTFLTIEGRNREAELLDVSIFSEEDWALVEAALRTVGVSDEGRADWLADVRGGFWDALTALQLTLLPHLEELEFLDVPGDYNGDLKWLKNLMKQVAASQQQGGDDSRAALLLPELREVSMCWWDTEDGMDIEELVVFMAVPSVRELHAHMVSSEHWEAPPGVAFSLKELGLYCSSINSESLRDLIHCCPQLEKLTFETSGALVGYDVLIPSVLSPALATLKGCLQELEITDEENNWGDPDDGDPELPMISFADFGKLHTLSLRACMLLGKEQCRNESEAMEVEAREADSGLRKSARLVDVVPKALEKLSLNNCGSGILGQLEELLVRTEELTPVLKQIKITATSPINKAAAEMLVDAFGERQVRLEFERDSRHEWNWEQ